MKIMTGGDAPEVNSGAATSSRGVVERRARHGQRAQLGDAGESRAASQLGRTHPLTVEGDEIGSFDLTFACGEPGKRFHRHLFRAAARGEPQAPDGSDRGRDLDRRHVGAAQGGVVAARRTGRWSSIPSRRGRVPVELFKSFAESRSRSLTDRDRPARTAQTAIRIGNAGDRARSLPSAGGELQRAALRARDLATALRQPSSQACAKAGGRDVARLGSGSIAAISRGWLGLQPRLLNCAAYCVPVACQASAAAGVAASAGIAPDARPAAARTACWSPA